MGFKKEKIYIAIARLENELIDSAPKFVVFLGTPILFSLIV